MNVNTKYTNYFTGLQLCFGQPVDIEMLTLLRSKVNEVAEAVQTWMLKKKQVLNFFFNCFIMHVSFLHSSVLQKYYYCSKSEFACSMQGIVIPSEILYLHLGQRFNLCFWKNCMDECRIN